MDGKYEIDDENMIEKISMGGWIVRTSGDLLSWDGSIKNEHTEKVAVDIKVAVGFLDENGRILGVGNYPSAFRWIDDDGNCPSVHNLAPGCSIDFGSWLIGPTISTSAAEYGFKRSDVKSVVVYSVSANNIIIMKYHA